MYEIIRISLFVIVLLVIGWIDGKKRIIPNRIVYPAIIGAFLVNAFSVEVSLLSCVVGAFSLAVFLYFCAIILKNLGFGDVKLAFLMGAMLGFPEGMVALVIGVLLGGVTALVLIISRIRTRKDTMAYGPFLVIGTVFSLIGSHLGLLDFLYNF